MLGLNYLHKQSITHRDIKPENILLVSNDLKNFEIKIADLGFAQQFDRETGLSLVLGTPLYMAPELVLNKKYTEKVDVWSLGIICYQLLSGRTPFDSNKIKKINWNILNKPIEFPDKQWAGISKQAQNFIAQCLIRDQHKRPSIAELFEHPWITEADIEALNDQDTALKI
jgi:serine/threonine protein kinase